MRADGAMNPRTTTAPSGRRSRVRRTVLSAYISSLRGERIGHQNQLDAGLFDDGDHLKLTVRNVGVGLHV